MGLWGWRRALTQRPSQSLESCWWGTLWCGSTERRMPEDDQKIMSTRVGYAWGELVAAYSSGNFQLKIRPFIQRIWQCKKERKSIVLKEVSRIKQIYFSGWDGVNRRSWKGHRKKLLELNKCRAMSFGNWRRIKSRILCCEWVDYRIFK